MKYDPLNRTHRVALATSLLALFERALFTEVTIEGCKERVFAREVPNTDGKIRVLVYSTIEGDACRNVGKDAIRVCAVYHGRDDRERGIASAEKRVNRVGQLNAISERVIDRMRQVWKAVLTRQVCHCGAPVFKSKVRKATATRPASGGNLVCADLCWKSADDLAHDSYRRPARRGYGRRYSAARW